MESRQPRLLPRVSTYATLFWLILPGMLLIGFWGCQSEKVPLGSSPNGGLALPDGFVSIVVADSLGSARHLAVNHNGDIYLKLRYPEPNGENVALRDLNNDGKADIIKQFGNYQEDGKYGTGMRIYQGYLYFSTAGRVIRHKLKDGELVPSSEPEVMLTDDYKNAKYGYEHIAKPITFDQEGHMYVPFGAPGDVCQIENRKPGSLGQDPCPELEWHGGVWQFDAHKSGQTQADGFRYATGIRSIVAMDWNHMDNTLYALQHGRDNFSRVWPDLYDDWESAMLPSEEFLRVKEGTDAGWPYYYYDQMQGKKLLNPEYGGDGQKQGNGLDYEQPLIGFPGHWAPNDLLFYQGDQFPPRYKDGAFIAFHGSTIRAPYPQSGYFIGFVPFKNGEPSGPWEVFADGFAQVDTIFNTSDAMYRPMGLAEGPDGSLYISESEKGKIWKVMFQGDRNTFDQPSLAQMETHKLLPHIKTPHPVHDDLTPTLVVAGQKLYNLHCGACHQADGKGDGTRFPPLAGSEWVMGPKSELIEIVLQGKQGAITVKGEEFLGVMPPLNYLSDQEISQILTFVRIKFGDNASGIEANEIQRIRNVISSESSEEI